MRNGFPAFCPWLWLVAWFALPALAVASAPLQAMIDTTPVGGILRLTSSGESHDRIWMEAPMATFFRISPVLELLDFLERLAPFSTPHRVLQDPVPKIR